MKYIPTHLVRVFQVLKEQLTHSSQDLFLDAIGTMMCDALDVCGMLCNLTQWYQILETRYPEGLASLRLIIEVLGEAILANPFSDILGQIYECLGLGSASKGQYLTPGIVTNAVADMATEHYVQSLKEIAVLTVNDPSCGSGAFLLSVAQAVKDAGYDPIKRLKLDGLDIDETMVRMCYIQLTYNGLTGTVKDTGKGIKYLTPSLVGLLRTSSQTK